MHKFCACYLFNNVNHDCYPRSKNRKGTVGTVPKFKINNVGTPMQFNLKVLEGYLGFGIFCCADHVPIMYTATAQ